MIGEKLPFLLGRENEKENSLDGIIDTMENEVFFSEWSRVTWITRKRMLYNQEQELEAHAFMLDRLETYGFTATGYAGMGAAKNKALADMTLKEGIEALQKRLWRIRRGDA